MEPCFHLDSQSKKDNYNKEREHPPNDARVPMWLQRRVLLPESWRCGRKQKNSWRRCIQQVFLLDSKFKIRNKTFNISIVKSFKLIPSSLQCLTNEGIQSVRKSQKVMGKKVRLATNILTLIQELYF